MWRPKGEEGMSAAESAGSESSSSSAASDFPSTSSYASDQQPASTSSAVPAADADSASSDPSSSEAAGSSPGADTAAGASGQKSDSEFGGLTSDQQLCEVGTFAQVHTIVPIDPKRAQLLLLGHRRLKRTKQVILQSCVGGMSSTAPENCKIPALLPLGSALAPRMQCVAGCARVRLSSCFACIVMCCTMYGSDCFKRATDAKSV